MSCYYDLQDSRFPGGEYSIFRLTPVKDKSTKYTADLEAIPGQVYRTVKPVYAYRLLYGTGVAEEATSGQATHG